MIIQSDSSWNKHYGRERSLLGYPDENLVRLITSYKNSNDIDHKLAIDIGAGSGRHVKLLKDFGFKNIFATDITEKATLINSNIAVPAIRCNTSKSPFKDNSFDLAICWGSLHYDTQAGVTMQISEIERILKPGGQLFGTFRKADDNYLVREKKLSDNCWLISVNDLESCPVTFADENYLKILFKNFSFFEFGYMQRTRLNDSKIISHYFFKAVL
ncbi:MAG: class I SAM-dependent methyltransferase [Spirochaetes bacterium]|nr:class I SAM-dependent methyltransferase [Spirochaetota bacterium]MBN2770526.1 class I SAM-dependent methyltransferase [Spirochaetota bacterium]